MHASPMDNSPWDKLHGLRTEVPKKWVTCIVKVNPLGIEWSTVFWWSRVSEEWNISFHIKWSLCSKAKWRATYKQLASAADGLLWEHSKITFIKLHLRWSSHLFIWLDEGKCKMNCRVRLGWYPYLIIQNAES